jgi:hypothetical protein
MPYFNGTFILLDYILSQLNPVHTVNLLYLWSTLLGYWRLLLRFIDKTFVLIFLIHTPFNQYNLVCWLGKTVSLHIKQFSPSAIYLFHFNSRFFLEVFWSLILKNIYVFCQYGCGGIIFFPLKCARFILMIVLFCILSFFDTDLYYYLLILHLLAFLITNNHQMHIQIYRFIIL